MFCIVGSDVYRTAMQIRHYCASRATLTIFTILLTATYECQHYKGVALLFFHSNNLYANAPRSSPIVERILRQQHCSSNSKYIFYFVTCKIFCFLVISNVNLRRVNTVVLKYTKYKLFCKVVIFCGLPSYFL